MNQILHDLEIRVPAEMVFDAFTRPDQLNNWWTLKSSGKPVVGSGYNLYFSPEFDWRGEVTRSMPNAIFEITMTRADEDWTSTRFGFELKEGNGITKVSFYHKGWKSENHHFRRSSYCWAILLNGLKKYLEEGVIIPFAERE